MPVDNSRLSGFYKLSIPERRAMLAELAGLSDEQVQAWADAELDEGTADRMIENVIGRYSLPIGVCLLYTSPSPRDKRQSRMPSSA